MNKDNSYITMAQAVKKFGKSRQTFYNHINKGKINTKKIHHKAYLSVRDIERVLGEFVGDKPKLGSTSENVPVVDIETVSLENNPDYHGLSSQVAMIERKVQTIPNEFSMYMQQVNMDNKHYTDTLYSRLQGYIKNMEEYVQSVRKTSAITRKKQLFTAGIFLFTLCNILLIWFLS